jgi:hypothetical protein
MRLGFRKANNGSRRGKKCKAKTARTPKSVANNSGTGAFWPPAWPDDDASGRGGMGPGSRGGCGGAERSGRGEALAGAAGEGLAGEGEIVSLEPSYRRPPTTGRGLACETGTCALRTCGFFLTRARRAGGVRSGRPSSLLSAATAGIDGPASTLWAARGAAAAA